MGRLGHAQKTLQPAFGYVIVIDGVKTHARVIP